MTTSVIVAGARTPIGRLMGSLKDFSGSDLGAIRIALDTANVAAAAVDYVIMGQVLTAGAGEMPARQAAVAARASSRWGNRSRFRSGRSGGPGIRSPGGCAITARLSLGPLWPAGAHQNLP